MKKRTVEQAFSDAAPEYDTWVKQALPTYDELFSVAVEIMPFKRDQEIEVVASTPLGEAPETAALGLAVQGRRALGSTPESPGW